MPAAAPGQPAIAAWFPAACSQLAPPFGESGVVADFFADLRSPFAAFGFAPSTRGPAIASHNITHASPQNDAVRPRMFNPRLDALPRSTSARTHRPRDRWPAIASMFAKLISREPSAGAETPVEGNPPAGQWAMFE
jgi:hypothetical protein